MVELNPFAGLDTLNPFADLDEEDGDEDELFPEPLAITPEQPTPEINEFSGLDRPSEPLVVPDIAERSLAPPIPNEFADLPEGNEFAGLDEPGIVETAAGAISDVQQGVKRVVGVAGERVGEAFKEPIGLGEESRSFFEEHGIFPTPEEIRAGPTPIKTFNKSLIESLAAGGDILGRTIVGGVNAIGGALGQIVKEFGGGSGAANRLERDVQALATVGAVVSGTPIARGVKRFGQAQEIEKAVDKSLSKVAPAKKAEAKQVISAEIEQNTVAAKPGNIISEGLTEPRIRGDLSKNVIDAAEEIMTSGAVVRDPNRLISDQILELLQTNRLKEAQFNEILTKHGVTSDDFAQIWRVNVKKAAQDMNALSQAEARLKKLLGDPLADEALRASGVDSSARAQGFWKRLDNIRRGLLVTQLSTAMRNFEVQTGRVGIDVLQRGLDAGIRKLFLPKGVVEQHPADVFGSVMNLARRNKGRVNEVLSRFPKDADDLFFRFSSDIRAAKKGDPFPERAVNFLNFANRFQEYVIRRAVFAGALDRRIKATGGSIDELVANGQVGTIPREAVQGAVQEALEFTFAKNFSPFAKGAEGIAGRFINFVNGMPGATLPIPFPRFMMNSLKFQFEFSPLGFLKVLSPAERAKIAAGDVGTISKASMGTALLHTALQIRDSEFAGEKWYELKLPDGRIIDARPFNPLASYLFVADIYKRDRDGTLNTLTTKDVVQGIAASNLRAGAGLFIVDSFIEGLLGIEDREKAVKAIKGLAGNVGAGVLLPLNQIKEALSEFDENQRVIRDVRDEPFLGPFKKKIPGADVDLPEVELPTREAPPIREAPLLRQLTGIPLRGAKNPLESELDRLGFTRQDISRSTGDPTADRLINRRMGPLAEQILVPFVQSPKYQGFSNERKSVVLKALLSEVRNRALRQAQADDPKRFGKLKIARQPKRIKRLLKSILGVRPEELIEP